MEHKTDVNYPVITARDARLLWQQKKYTKKAAERALQYSDNKHVSPFDFLEKLLVRFGVFVPIDLSISKTFLGGRDYSRYCEYSEYPALASDNSNEIVQVPKFFFLPSLLGPGDPNVSEIWTFKTVESWKTTICDTILFPGEKGFCNVHCCTSCICLIFFCLTDGVPPGLMERITASILSDLYSNPTPSGQCSLSESEPPQPQSELSGQLRIKEILCWRSAFFLKIGSEIADNSGMVVNESIVEIFATLVDQDSQLCAASDSMGVGMRRLIFSGKGPAGDMGSKIWKGG